jgi:hypothetical protein
MNGRLKVIYSFMYVSYVTISTRISQSSESTLEVTDSMTIDEGTYLVLRSASGAFTCRYPPVPKRWNSIDRPHVALLLPDGGNIFSVFLSNPEHDESEIDQALEVSDLNRIPPKSIIEIRHSNALYAYYRRDNGSWTKVAEANDPFVVEVFSHGYAPIVMNMIPQI